MMTLDNSYSVQQKPPQQSHPASRLIINHVHRHMEIRHPQLTSKVFRLSSLSSRSSNKFKFVAKEESPEKPEFGMDGDEAKTQIAHIHEIAVLKLRGCMCRCVSRRRLLCAAAAVFLFLGACSARPLSQRRIAPMAHFSAYSLQDYSAMPACFPRCFVEELAQRPRAARLEEMTRFIERLRLRAPSEQTFGVMAATLLAVRGDDAPFESGRAYDLFLHVRCFWRKGAPARPKADAMGSEVAGRSSRLSAGLRGDFYGRL